MCMMGFYFCISFSIYETLYSDASALNIYSLYLTLAAETKEMRVNRLNAFNCRVGLT